MNDDSTKTTREIALPLGKTDAGHLKLLRVRGDESGPKEVSLGVCVPVQDGVPLPPGADLLQMRPCGDHLHVETVYESPDKPKGGHFKPLSVSREKFESNWDRIFGKKTPKGELLN